MEHSVLIFFFSVSKLELRNSLFLECLIVDYLETEYVNSMLMENMEVMIHLFGKVRVAMRITFDMYLYLRCFYSFQL